MTDELERYCIRMLGDPAAARSAAEAARSAGGEDRGAALQAAVAECRRKATEPAPVSESRAGQGLAAAVAAELGTAVARLPGAEREALALRDVMNLSYDDMAAATGTAPGEVALLLAGARLHLRAALRGTPGTPAACPEHDRALRTVAARQDGEPVPAADDDWLIDHLAICPECARDHAALLEAAACYGAWGAAEGASAAGS